MNRMNESAIPLSMRWWSEYGARVDAVTADVHAALAAQGIPSILLKGPSIAAWLYTLDDVRRYGDSDFLIRRADWEAAGAVLTELGFAPQWDAMDHRGLGSLSSFAWERGADNVDLHATLNGLEAPADRVWETLSAHTVDQLILDVEIPVLAPTARAMHVALHAAQHHRFEVQPREDLVRALQVVPLEEWRAALEIARELDGVAAFAAGLRQVDGGSELAATLGVEDVSTVETRLREEWVPVAEGLNELLAVPGVLGKLRTGLREAFPRPAFMRWWSPVARRSRLGLALMYLWRPIWLASRLPSAAWAVRKARKTR